MLARIVTKRLMLLPRGGNYGWSIYEGDLPVDSQQSSKNNISDSTDVIFPAMGYNHYDVNKKEGSAAITGGRFYRSTTDPCMYGRICIPLLYGQLRKLQPIAGTSPQLQSLSVVPVILQ
ncbi:putative six-bladed beta-propeller, TolB [Helianthus annuus]|nr:putative six-bladed beta-propeller, TolB [Helianthus annuus]